jgi:flagellar basal body P-ring formation protein FlgA
MQMLCPPSLPPRAPRPPRRGWVRRSVSFGWGWVAALGLSLLALPLLAHASVAPGTAVPSPITAPSPAPTWPTASSPELALQQLVIQWLATRHGADATRLSLAPLDARVQVRPCQSGLALDQPFSNAQTVRVRCGQPAWQLYVRATTALDAPAPNTVPATDSSPATRTVVVASALLQRGTRLTEAHLKLVEMPAAGLPAQVIGQLSDALQAEVVRDLMPGTPVRSQDIRPALLVRRGQMVMISIGESGGFQVQARLEALQDGRMGEQIRLKNRESGKQISAVVTGLNTAQAL